MSEYVVPKLLLIENETRIPTYMTTIPQRNRQTDDQTDRQLGLAIPRYATLRAVNILYHF